MAQGCTVATPDVGDQLRIGEIIRVGDSSIAGCQEN
jgi:hypothetical protein